MLNQPGGFSTAAGGAGSTAVDATLTSAGSTRLVGQVTVANPTTAVTVSNPSTSVTVTNPTTAVTVSNPTTSVSLSSQHTVTVGNPTTAVTVSNPTTSVSLSSQHTVTVGNPTTAVTVSSGVILAAGSSANTLGAVAQGAGSTSVAPWYVISTAAAGAGSTTVDANLTSAGSTKLVGLVSLSSQHTVTVGNPTTAVTVSSGVILAAGSSANTIGSVALVAGASANTIGSVSQGAGSTSVTPWYVEGWGFSSAMTVRTTINSSVDVALLAASTARRATLIQNQSTGTALLVSFTTAAVSSGGAYTFQVPANGFVALGGQVGNMPNYQGPIRGKMNSTAVAGPVFVTEFNSS